MVNNKNQIFLLWGVDCVDCEVGVDSAHGVEVRRGVGRKRTPIDKVENIFKKLC